MAHVIDSKDKRDNRLFLPHSNFRFILQIQWTRYGIERESAAYPEEMIVEAMDQYLRRQE